MPNSEARIRRLKEQLSLLQELYNQLMKEGKLQLASQVAMQISALKKAIGEGEKIS